MVIAFNTNDFLQQMKDQQSRLDWRGKIYSLYYIRYVNHSPCSQTLLKQQILHELFLFCWFLFLKGPINVYVEVQNIGWWNHKIISCSTKCYSLKEPKNHNEFYCPILCFLRLIKVCPSVLVSDTPLICIL